MAELFREVGQRRKPLITNIGSKELAGLDLALKDKQKDPRSPEQIHNFCKTTGSVLLNPKQDALLLPAPWQPEQLHGANRDDCDRKLPNREFLDKLRRECTTFYKIQRGNYNRTCTKWETT